MAFFHHHYPATPTLLIPDGLQARADWENPLPTSSPPRLSSSPPLAYTPSNYDCGDYETHDPRDCVHARLLCDQRFAALMADLERSQCRCERSTWGRRTKSFLCSLKKRALSLRSRRKSQDAYELDGQEPEPEWPGAFHPVSLGELPAVAGPTELQPSHVFISELDACPTGGPPGPTAQMNPYSSPPAPHPHSTGYGQAQAQYNSSIGTFYFNQMGHQTQAQAVDAHELAAHVPNPNLQATPWYSGPATATFPSVSPLSPSTMSETGSHSFISPQSSVSSVSVSMFTEATAVAAPEAPIFTAHTTSSPIEYGQDDSDIAPWNGIQSSAHQNSWDSTTTTVAGFAELPNNSLESIYPASGAVQWAPKPTTSTLSELGGVMPLMRSAQPSQPQQFCETRPMAPLGLATVAEVKHDLNASGWRAPRKMGMEKHPMIAASDFSRPSFQARAPPVRPGPRPLISEGRQHSYDSTADTVLDLPISDDAHREEDVKVFRSPETPIFQLPSQQNAATNKPPPYFKRRKAQQPPEPVCCQTCEFFPAAGTNRRRKMEKHMLTDGHRKKTGQLDGGERETFPCRVSGCSSTFNREDNLVQHMSKKHGVQSTAGAMRGRRKMVVRGLGESLRLTV